MVVFSSYGLQVIMSFLMLTMIFMILPRAQVSANRINEVLDTEITVKDGNVKEDLTEEEREEVLEFNAKEIEHAREENEDIKKAKEELEKIKQNEKESYFWNVCCHGAFYIMHKRRFECVSV